MKGLELEILADLIHSGALQHLDYIYIDFHESMDDDHKSFRWVTSDFELKCNVNQVKLFNLYPIDPISSRET